MEWINVKDYLPPLNKGVLILCNDDDIYVARRRELQKYHYEHWEISCECREGSFPENIKYWMPLPEPPKEL